MQMITKEEPSGYTDIRKIDFKSNTIKETKKDII